MKQVFKLYITKNISVFGDGKFSVNDFDMSKPFGKQESDYILLGTIDQEIDVPEMSIAEQNQLQIDSLEKTIQTERAESQSRVNHLLERISKLKAIAHDGAELSEEEQ